MTVGTLLATMSSSELYLWMAHDHLSKQEREKAQRQADKGMNPKRPRRRR